MIFMPKHIKNKKVMKYRTLDFQEAITQYTPDPVPSVVFPGVLSCIF